MKKSYLYRALLIIMSILLVVAMFACTRQNPAPTDPSGIYKPPTNVNDQYDIVRKKASKTEIEKGIKVAMENAKKMNYHSDDPDWYVIDLNVTFEFDDYVPDVPTKTHFNLVIRANINLKDNSKSELFFEYLDKTVSSTENELKLGVYYLAKTAYIVLDGASYYLEEINLTELGSLIAKPLMSSGIDVAAIVGGFLAGATGISLIDDMFVLIGNLFDPANNAIITTTGPNVNRIDYEVTLKLNELIKLLKLGLIDISWTTFGLPNLDPILETLFGFSLDYLMNQKVWPQMTSNMTAMTTWSDQIPVFGEDNKPAYDTQGRLRYTSGYVYNGVSLAITTPVTASQPRGEYALNLQITPFKMSGSDTKMEINFAGLGLGDDYKDNRFSRAGLLNLEFDTILSVNSKEKGKLTLNDVLGTMVDLGGIGEIPLNFPENATSYEFKLNAKLHYDFFDRLGTRIEATIFYQNNPFLMVYYDGTGFYIDCSNIRDKDGQIIPNLKIPININDMLSPLLGSITYLFDPNYVASATSASNAEGDASGGFDIMLLIDILAANIKKEPMEEGDLIKIEFDNAALNQILNMILGSGGLGIKGLTLSVETANILDTIKLTVDLNDDVDVKLELKNVGYFGMPKFDNETMILDPNKEFIDIYDASRRYYNVEASGQFIFGMNQTPDDGGIDLSPLMNDLLGNILFKIGITESVSFVVSYTLKVAINLTQMYNTALSINFYYGDDIGNVFLMIYYQANEDALYIDLSLLHKLDKVLGITKVLGELPKLKIENIGIYDLLAGISSSTASAAEKIDNITLVGDEGYDIINPGFTIGDFVGGLMLGVNQMYFAALNEEGEVPAGGFDIMELLGYAISINVMDEISALVVNIDRQILTILMGMLGVTAEMPEINAHIQLKLIDVDENGYLSGHFGIYGSKIVDGEYVEAIYADLRILQKIGLVIDSTPPEFFIEAFESEKFVPLTAYLDSLVIGIEAKGSFKLNSNSPTYTNDFINDMLSGLIEGLALRFGVDGFLVDLRYELIINVNFNDITRIIDFVTGASDDFPTSLGSSLQIVLWEAQTIVFALYLTNDTIYLDLSYFGIPSIGIKGVGMLINELVDMLSASAENADSPINLPKNGVKFGEGETALPLIELLISPYRISAYITKTTFAAILGVILGSDELPLQIHDSALVVDVENGFSASISTRIEDFDISIAITSVKINLMNQDITPIVVDESKFQISDEGGLPTYFYISAGGQISLTAYPEIIDGKLENKYINLSPALKALIGDIDLNAYLVMLGIVEGVADLQIEAAINIRNIVESLVKITLYSGDKTSQKPVLTIFYAGGDLFIDTEAFGIGKIYIKDVDTVFSQLVSGGEDAENLSNSEDPAVTDALTYLDIMFVKGGIVFHVTKDILVAALKALGVDLSPYLAGIDELTVGAGFYIEPIKIYADVVVDGITLSLQLGGLELYFDRAIVIPDPDTDGYHTIEELETIYIKVGGMLDLSIMGSDSGIYFDEIIRQIKEDLLNSGVSSDLIDFDALLNFGLVLDIINGLYGGRIYYDIEAHINLLDISKLNIALRLTSENTYLTYMNSVDKDDSILGDILGFYIIGNNGKLDAYLNATGIGIKDKIMIKDVAGLIASFGSNGETPLEMAKNADGRVAPIDIAAAHVLITIAIGNEEQMVPILINVTSGAFYSLISMLMGIDLSTYMAAFEPSASIAIGDSDKFIDINIGLKDLIGVNLTLNSPTVGVNGSLTTFNNIKNDSAYYCINDNPDMLLIRLTIEGSINFSAEDTNDESEIDLSTIIGMFFKEAKLDLLLKNSGYSDKRLDYKVDLKLDIMAIIKGGLNGLKNGMEAYIQLSFYDVFEQKITGELMLILTKGSIYADLSILNAGQIRIDNVFDLFTSTAMSSSLVEFYSPKNSTQAGYSVGELADLARIKIVLGNNTGLVVSILGDFVAVILNAFTLPEGVIGDAQTKLGDLFLEIVNNDFEFNIAIGKEYALSATIDIANYKVSVAMHSLELSFARTDVIPVEVANYLHNYTPIDLAAPFVHLDFNIDFGYEMIANSDFILNEVLNSLEIINGLTIEAIVKILSQIGSDFRLNIVANINFNDILKDGASIADRLYSSSLAIKLFNITGGLQDEILAIHFVGGNVYLDLEFLSIQKVVIPNAINYFGALFGLIASDNPLEVMQSLQNGEDMSKHLDFDPLATALNVVLCPEGLVVHVGMGALFAILDIAIGSLLDVDGLEDSISTIGILDIKGTLFNIDHIMRLDLTFFNVSNEGENPVVDKSKYVKLYLGISTKFEIAFADTNPIIPPSGYHAINENIPTIGINTTISFTASAKDSTQLSLEKDPVASILQTLFDSLAKSAEESDKKSLVEIFKQLTMTIYFGISGDQTAKFELELFLNLNLSFDVASIEALQGQIIGYVVKTVEGKVERTPLVQINIHEGDLYIDLSRIGGPTFCISEVMQTILGTKDKGEEDEVEPIGNAEGDPATGAIFGINVDISKDGIFVYFQKLALASILGLISFDSFSLVPEIDIFESFKAQLYLKPAENAIKLGLDIFIGSDSVEDLLHVQIGANDGWNIQFMGYDSPELETPGPNYIYAHNVDTLLIDATFEIKLETKEGEINLSGLWQKIFENQPLSTSLPQRVLVEQFGDTLVFDVKGVVNLFGFDDILNALQVSIHIYSKAAPDSFSLVVTYYKNSIYIDATGIGLSKIKIDDITGFIQYFIDMFTGNTPEDVSEEMQNDVARYKELVAIIRNSDEEREEEKIEAIIIAIRIIFDSESGLLVTVSKEVFNIIFGLLGVTIGDVMTGVLEPQIYLGIDNNLSLFVGLSLDAAKVLDEPVKEETDDDDEVDPEDELDNSEETGGETQKEETKLGGADLRLSFITNNLKIGIMDEYIFEFEGVKDTNIPQVITKEEILLYTNYSELSIFTQINMSLEVELQNGRISLDGTIAEIFRVLGLDTTLNTDIVLTGGNEKMRVDIVGEIGVDFKELLSRDPAKIKSSIAAIITISYTILDENDQVYVPKHDLVTAYLTDDVVYLSIYAFDSHVNVSIPNMSLTTIFTDLFGVTPGTDSPNNLSDTKDNYLKNMEEGLKAIGNETPNMDTIESLVYLNTSGLSVILSKNLLAGVFDLVGNLVSTDSFDLTTIDFEKVLDEILTGASVGLYTDKGDGGFSLGFNLFKNQIDTDTNQSAGYNIELSLLNGSFIKTDRAKFTEFNSYVRGEGEDNPLKDFYASCYDSTMVAWSFSLSVEIILGAEFREFILDWSTLFKDQTADTAFYLQVFDSMKGEITLKLQIAVLITEITKLKLDAIISLCNGDGDEVMVFYFIGMLNRQQDLLDVGADPKLYLSIPGMGIEGIKLDSDVFVQFLNLNLTDMLNAILGIEPGNSTLRNEEGTGDGETGTDDDGGNTPPPFNPEEDDPYWWSSLLDSIVIAKGQIMIVVAKTALQNILTQLLNFPFDDVGNITLLLDVKANRLRFDFALDNEKELTLENLTLGSIENMVPLDEKWEISEINKINPQITNLDEEKHVKTLMFDAGYDRSGMFMLYHDIDEVDFANYVADIASWGFTVTSAQETIINQKVWVYNFVDNPTEGLPSGGAIVRFNNGVVAMILTNEVDRVYTLTDLNIGLISSAEILTKAEAFEELNKLDSTIPALESVGSMYLGAYNFYDSISEKDALVMIYTGVTPEQLRAYVGLLSDQGYVWSRRDGAYYVTKNVIEYDDEGKSTRFSVSGVLTLSESGILMMSFIDITNMFNLSMELSKVDFKLSTGNIIADRLGLDYELVLSETFFPLNNYKWEFGVYSELTFDDALGGLFDLSDMTGSILDMVDGGSGGFLSTLADIKIALQSSEDISITLGFDLRVFIDFGQLDNIRLQLSITYNGKEIVFISYIGSIETDPTTGFTKENASLFVDLSGLSLPAIKIDRIQIASMLKTLIGKLDFSSSDETDETDGPQNAEKDLASRGYNLADITFGAALLLFTASSSKVSLAITGALAYSLIAGIPGLDLRIPLFNNFEIGYAESELDKTHYTTFDKTVGEGSGAYKIDGIVTKFHDDTAIVIVAKEANLSSTNKYTLDDASLKSLKQFTPLGKAWPTTALTAAGINVPVLGGIVTSVYEFTDKFGRTAYYISLRKVTTKMYEDYTADLAAASFNNVSDVYGKNLSGLILRLTDDTPYEQAFRIGFNFRKGDSSFGTSVTSTINPQSASYYEDIGTISEVGLSLDMEMRLRTKKNNGEKTEQVRAIEAIVEVLLGMSENSVNLEMQDSVMTFGVSFKIYANLKTLSETTLMLALTYNDESFMSIYYFAKTNLVYVDLSGVGLFTASISGIDLMSIIGAMLSGFVTEGEGINIHELVGGQGYDELYNASSSDLLVATDQPLVRILLGNDDITINPNMAVLTKLVTGMELPQFNDIRLSTNLSYGLNNLDFRIRLDGVGNNISFSVAENMFGIAIGSKAANYQIKDSVLGNNKYGALSGISLNAAEDGSMNMNMDMAALVGTLFDTLKVKDLKIYLDKRSDYWWMRDLRYLMDDNVHYDPTEGSGFDDEGGDLGLGDLLGGGVLGDIIDWVVGLTGIKSFTPVYLNNAYRRTRLSITKASDNQLDINLYQLTQVLGIKGSYLDMDPADWTPMHAKAFIAEYALKLSLSSALVLDLTPIIKQITVWIVSAVGRLLDPTGIFVGIGADMIAEAAAPIIADLVGNISGYGNPLRLGKIIDDITGGIEVFRLFLPQMLAADKDPDPYGYGSVYGQILNESNQGIEGALVRLSEGNLGTYESRTDKDGYYSLINLPVGNYTVQVTAQGYNALVLPGEPDMFVTIASFTNTPTKKADYMLRVESEDIYYGTTIKGVVRDENGNPIEGMVVYFGTSEDYQAITNVNGEYSIYVDTAIHGRVHIVRTGSGVSAQIIVTYSYGEWNVDLNTTLPSTGTIGMTFMMVKDERLINGDTVEEILSGKTLTDLQYWNAYNSTYNTGVVLGDADQYYYDPVLKCYLAYYNNLNKTGYLTLTSNGVYPTAKDGVVDRSINYNRETIYEVRWFPKSEQAVVAIKKADLTPVVSDFEVWLKLGDRTIRQSDYYDGHDEEITDNNTMRITPRNYADGRVNGVGFMTIEGLMHNSNYYIKIRSSVYKNMDLSVPANTTMYESYFTVSSDGNRPYVILVPREKHWSSDYNEASSMLQGVRIRLGADVLDANGEGTLDEKDPGYAPDRIPDTFYSWAEEFGWSFLNKIVDFIPSLIGSITGMSWITNIINIGWGNIPNAGDQSNYLDDMGKPVFMPFTNYIQGYEAGAVDTKNNVSYVEVWLNSDLLTDIFNILYGILLPLAGMSSISTTQVYTIPDVTIAPPGTSDNDVKYNNYTPIFDEDGDIVANNSGKMLFDPVYNNHTEYILALKMAGAKLPAGVISWLVNFAVNDLLGVDFLNNQWLRWIIQFGATSLLKDQLDQVTRLLSHVLPLVFPYSMIAEKDLANSPLQETAVSSSADENIKTDVNDLIIHEGVLESGTKLVSGDEVLDAPVYNDMYELEEGYLRELDFHDMSVYVKVALNNNVQTRLDRIILFINGATYDTSDLSALDKSQIIDENKGWTPICTALRADTVVYDYDADGNRIFKTAADEALDAKLVKWQRTNVVNSYVKVNDYLYTTDEQGVTTRRLVATTWIRDVYGHADEDDFEYRRYNINPDGSHSEKSEEDLAYIDVISAKFDAYLELDIVNTGIKLRVVRGLQGTTKWFIGEDTGGGPISRTTMEPPSEIVFHDPYNPQDFTAYNGTWANVDGGVRHNIDAQGNFIVNSVVDILPTRNEAIFYDGTSTKTAGVQMYWDMSRIDFRPSDKDAVSYIYGYCANYLYTQNSSGMVDRIKVTVKKAIVVNPLSTLMLNDDGTEEIENDIPVLALPEIDPLSFNKEAYLNSLPTQFAYAYKMQYKVGDDYEIFTPDGQEPRDYIYKRYVFNDLTWDMSETELRYNSGTAYIKLTYGYKISGEKGSDSEKTTIKVPIKVKDRTINALNAVIDGTAGIDGKPLEIINSKMIFNPLMHENPKGAVESLTKLFATTGSGIYEWDVIAIDATSLDDYDPLAFESREFNVYYSFKDDFGGVQKVRVVVEVLSRTIESSSLDNLGTYDEDINTKGRSIKITPFVNNGLGLPNEIIATYKGVYQGNKITETLYEGIDYVWEIPKMTYTFEGESKLYEVYARIGSGDNLQTLTVYVRVFKMDPKLVENIIIAPYGDTNLSDIQRVIFNSTSNEAIEAEVAFDFDESKILTRTNGLYDENTNPDGYKTFVYDGISYKTGVKFIEPSFIGESFQANVLIYDELFGGKVIRNVNITIRMTEISAVNPAAEAGTPIINQYYSDETINTMLDDENLTISIYKGAVDGSDVRVGKKFFEVVGWSYVDAGGIAASGRGASAFINVRIGNVGYNSGNKVWLKEVRLDLRDYLKDLTVKEIILENANTYRIDNPYNYTLPSELLVRFADDTTGYVPVLVENYNLGPNANDFYKYESVNGTITVGSMQNNFKTFDITFENGSTLVVEDVVFMKDDNSAAFPLTNGIIDIYAFDALVLPKQAKVNFKNGSSYTFNVYWKDIPEYTQNGAEFTLTAMIGDNVFGYVYQDLTINVKEEKILQFVNGGGYNIVGNKIRLNPYLDILDQLKAMLSSEVRVITNVGERLLNVVYPDIPYTYDQEYVYTDKVFKVGITNHMGLVGDPRGNRSDYSFEVREDVACRFEVEEKVAIGIKVGGVSYDRLTGSIYERIDFTNPSLTNDVVIIFNSGEGDSPMMMDIVWDTSGLSYTFLGGTYYVSATIAMGTLMEQTFTIEVFVRPSQLEAVAAVEGDNAPILDLDANRMIKGLIVDPFDGFIGLPAEKVMAKFKNIDELVEVYVQWSYQRIVNSEEYTISGGIFDASNNLAAIATIFVYNDDGTRAAIQSIEIPVEVLDRSIVSIEASKRGSTQKVLLPSTITLNPYDQAYSEKFDNADFAYYDTIYVTLKGGRVIEYTLSNNNYIIRDKNTKMSTNLNNLYTGREIGVDLKFGTSANGASKDAIIERHIDVTILDMTYESGFTNYYIDVYGFLSDVNNPKYNPLYSDKVEYSDGLKTLETKSGTMYDFMVTYDGKDINTKYVDKRPVAIDYSAGTGSLYAKFGNDYGGYQTFTINIYYEDRTIVSLFDTSTSPYYGAFTTTSGVQRQGFIFDPFAYYDDENFSQYPQSGDNVIFNTSNVVIGSFGLGEGNIKVVWSNTNVSLNYKGSEDGYATATVSTLDGRAVQKLYYPVKIMNRTVVSYTDVLIEPDYIISPYDFLNDSDLSKAVGKKIFKQQGEFTVNFTEGYSVRFTIGGDAGQFTPIGEVLDIYKPYMEDNEKDMAMSFVLDITRSINYKGKDARFFIKIPGFGMGEAGQQMASYDIQCYEQYIQEVYCYNSREGRYQPYLEWLQSFYGIDAEIITQNTEAASAGNNYTFNIHSPYTFIVMGGIPMPDKVQIVVGTLEGLDTYGVYSDIDTYWSAARSNFANIYYNRQQLSTSFRIELDNQSFAFTFGVNTDEWTLADSVLFDESQKYYSYDQIILLPSNAKNDSILKVTDTDKDNKSNIYTIKFATGKTFTFGGITGNGNAMDDYNKWSFDDVDFFAKPTIYEESTVQIATLTLGGRGGQPVQWKLNVQERHLVNQTMPSTVTLSVDYNESYVLPVSYKQLFADGSYDNAVDIPISYSALKDTAEDMEEEDKPAKNVQVNSSNSRRIETIPGKRIITAAAKIDAEEAGCTDGAIQYIEWTATSNRAYPAEDVNVGGTIYFITYSHTNFTYRSNDQGYGTQNNMLNNAFLHNPDSGYSYVEFAAGLSTDEWIYPSDLMPSYGGNTGTGDNIITKTNYKHAYSQSQSSQNSVPIIQIRENTRFTDLGLPLISLTWQRLAYTYGGFLGYFGTSISAKTVDLVYTLPWESSETVVYYTRSPYDPSMWNHAYKRYGSEVSNGIFGINTGGIDGDGYSRKGGRYTIVTKMKFANGVTYELYAAIEIV